MDLTYRPRRLRRTATCRRLVRETWLRVDDLIYPMFTVPGKGVKEPVASMPGVERHSVDLLVKEVQVAADLGIPAVLLFGVPEKKDEVGREAASRTGVVQRAVREIKKKVKDILVITDVCLCAYTTHGHCGIVEGREIDNDATLEMLAQVALSHAEAGADMVAPSDMMDGRVMAIRETLDERGFEMIPIMSYAVKYASSFYGPFRDAAESAPQFGDRRTHQMDPANALEAIREATLDVEEGADIIMVKPAMPYLDVLSSLRSELDLPLAAYQVSGEYSMIKAAAAQGWLDERRAVIETLIAIRRAGADLILTYHAKDAARWLQTLE